MEKIKIAQIGINTNSHSNEVFESLKKQNRVFEIVGYVFPEKERERLPQKAKAFDKYRELSLDDVLNALSAARASRSASRVGIPSCSYRRRRRTQC